MSSSDERRPRDRRTGATPSHAAVTYSGQQQRPLPPFPSVGRLVEKYTMLIERHRQRQNGLTPTGRRKSPSPQPKTPQSTSPQPTTPSPEDADGATVAGPPVDDPAAAAWSLMDDDDADGDCDEDDADEDGDDNGDDNGDDRRRRRRRRRSRQIGSCGGGVLLPGKWRRRNVSRAGRPGWEELGAGHHVVSRSNVVHVHRSSRGTELLAAILSGFVAADNAPNIVLKTIF